MLPSFTQVNSKHDKLFNVSSFYGLNVTQSTSLSNGADISCVLLFQPTLISLRRVEGNKVQPVKSPNNYIKLSMSKETEKFSYYVSSGTTSSILLTSKPNQHISISSQVGIRKLNVSPLITFAAKAPWFHSTVSVNYRQQLIHKFNFKSISAIDFTTMFGRENIGFGFQLLKRFVEPNSSIGSYALSIMFNRIWNKCMFEAACIVDKDVLLIYRFQKQVNQQWSFGTSFQLSNTLQPKLQVAWKAKLGKAVVHSSILFDGIIESHYRKQINKDFSMIITGSLDHQKNLYQLGFGLDYDNIKLK